jgi:hypothetical protein
MLSKTCGLAAIAVLALSIGVPALAESTSSVSSKARDPNEKVCEKIVVTGSRLNVRKVCATRAEWAERRLRAQQDIDKSQRERGLKGE